MQRIGVHRRIFLGIALVLAGSAYSQSRSSGDPADLDLGDLVEVRIQVASGLPQPISRAPGAISVITAEQIHGMAATHLDDVLETVAGLHVSPSRIGAFDPRYSIRGIESNSAGAALVLMNGIPINRPAEGAPILGFLLPVTAIQRVEVVRGPGSAVFGADAFGGVVNVVTKGADDIAGTKIGLRAGSFERREAWFQHGGHWAGWDVALTAEFQTVDGDRGRVIGRDRQTDLDELFGTSASLAPWSLDTEANVANLHVQAERAAWTARLWGFRNERGLGAGLAQALDPRGSQRSELLMGDLGHLTIAGDGAWELTQTLSYIGSRTDSDFNVFPPGAALPIGADGNVDFTNLDAPVEFPDGLISRPEVEQSTVSFDSVALYTPLVNHDLRFNAGYVYHDFDPADIRNFGPGVLDGAESVIGGAVTELTDTPFAFSPDVSRKHWYLSIQDQWTPSPKLELTAGARYDDFSDVGGTLNPRLGLVWRTSPRLSTKLLYGRSFRAPSFVQLYTSNNPSVLGNPDLDPETSETLEFVLDGRPRQRMRAVFSAFYYEAEDLIEFMPDPGMTSSTAQNALEQQGYGFELEFSWDAGDRFRLDANYAWQHSENADLGTNDHVTTAPHNQFYLGADWRFRAGWRGYMRVIRIGGRDRLLGDPRPELDDYTLVDLTVRRERVAGLFDVALLVRNLFDSDGREPAERVLVDDFPIQGRSLGIEISYPLR